MMIAIGRWIAYENIRIDYSKLVSYQQIELDQVPDMVKELAPIKGHRNWPALYGFYESGDSYELMCYCWVEA